MKHVAIIAIAFVFVPHAAQSTGRYTCEAVAQGKWLTETELTSMLTKISWKVNRMKPDGGCWEVYGTTPDGLRVEGYFHPETGRQLMLNQRGKIIFEAQP